MGTRPFELGIYSFVDHTPDPRSHRRIEAQRRIDHLLEEIERADAVGLDVYAIGEHHRDEYLASAPEVLLAAAAARTKRIRLSSAVTVLGSDDPVRVWQRFATVDLISGGRAEILAGRGSFVESFPLFGFDLRDYEALFEEKMDLLLQLRERRVVTWEGRHRPALRGAGVFPPPVQERMPIWVGVGGTPESAVRAGRWGVGMALAILGGDPRRFAPFAHWFRAAAAEAGHDPASLPLSLNLHGFVADDAQAAFDAFAPGTVWTMDRIGRERGWRGYGPADVAREAGPHGAVLLGDPETVARKIVAHHATFGHQRTMIQLTVGATPHRATLRAIELLGTEVLPRVRAALQAAARDDSAVVAAPDRASR